MSEIKLTYFDIRGRGEPIRLAFLIGEIPFCDDRVSFPDWKGMKATTPYGSLPLLTIDGRVAAQSVAILRYVGKLSKLYPEDALEALKVDEIVDTLADLSMCFGKYRGDDKDKLKEARESAVKEDVPRFFGGLEKRLALFGEGEWLVGDSVTVADLAITCLINSVKSGQFDHVPGDLFDGYTNAMKSYAAVMALPKVVEWYEKYPIKFI